MTEEGVTHEESMRGRAATVKPVLYDGGMNVIKVGNNIRKLREGAGMSLHDLADKSGVSVGYLSNLENSTENRADPTLSTLELIAHTLGTDLHALLEAHEHHGDHFEDEYGDRTEKKD
jgi:transcriptional regulator with XRE-family HTH domain